MNNLAVIAVAYNRGISLSRLLKSLSTCDYNSTSIDLIISIDKSDAQDQMKSIAENHIWQYGKKIIRPLSTKHGLRKHILSCGDLTSDYDAVIIFEDDIVAATNYFNYVTQALEFYSNDSSIAGISLYSPTINEMVEKPFTPVTTESDVYFIQSAQSWGQCWSKSMWSSFREWYNSNDEPLLINNDMPNRIYSWPDTSWKKYYMKYIVETNKYFVYPYISLSTNCSDVGQHVKQPNSMYQVPLLLGQKDYKLTPLELGIKYDVFFEPETLKLNDDLGIESKDICIDLYGSKLSNENKRYILSSKKMKFSILKSFGLKFRPHETNVTYNAEGNDLFLYDTKNKDRKDLYGSIKKTNLKYYVNSPWKYSIVVGFLGLFNYLKNKIP